MGKIIVVQKKQRKAEQMSMMPLRNIVAAIIWTIPLAQRFLEQLPGMPRFLVCVAFVMVYVSCSFLRFISIAPCVASTIIYVNMIWALIAGIEDNPARMIIKVSIAVFVGVLEFYIFINTLLKAK